MGIRKLSQSTLDTSDGPVASNSMKLAKLTNFPKHSNKGVTFQLSSEVNSIVFKPSEVKPWGPFADAGCEHRQHLSAECSSSAKSLLVRAIAPHPESHVTKLYLESRGEAETTVTAYTHYRLYTPLYHLLFWCAEWPLRPHTFLIDFHQKCWQRVSTIFLDPRCPRISWMISRIIPQMDFLS